MKTHSLGLNQTVYRETETINQAKIENQKSHLEEDLKKSIENEVNLVLENLKCIETIKEMQKEYNELNEKYLSQREKIIEKKWMTINSFKKSSHC